MGALLVEDNEIRLLAERLASARGLTKDDAVRLALINELSRGAPERQLQDITAEFRRTSPLRYDPDVVIDKAFYDSLYDDE